MTRTAINGLVEEFKLNKEPVGEFVRMSYDESMERYGSDKPDLRFGLELADLSDTVAESGFGVFKGCVEGGGKVRAIVYPGGSTKSRKDIRELEDFCKESGAKGLATIAVLADGQEAEGAVEMHGVRLKSSIMKFLVEDEVGQILEKTSAKPGDLICIVADSYKVTNEALGRLRSLIGDQCGLKDKSKMAFAFILDFPLVDWNEEEERWDPSHHPFTSPKAEDVPKLESDTAAVRADCYDLVCNGVEWASGSIRIHDPELQARVFKLIGFDEAAQQERFGHILEAFSYGAPPHGGIAPGIDRMVMFLTDDENIREVIAFPKMGSGLDPLMDAPSVIDSAQWAEVGLQVTPRKED
jgi:aspartyl-tRNA synthetase